MDDYRPRCSLSTERFVGLFSSPSSSPTDSSSFIAGDEFHEDDFMFSSAAPAAENPPAPPDPSRVPHTDLGLLAALHDGDKPLLIRRGGTSDAIPAALLRRKATISVAAAASASSGGGSLSPTAQPSPSSAAWVIPANPRPKRGRTPPAPRG